MVNRNIKILSVAFLLVFFAYNGIQQFITVYFSELNLEKVGFWSLVLIYLFILITNFFSGFIVSRFGVKKCLIFGSLFYSLFIFTLLTRTPFFVYLASALLGFGASILWTAQGAFFIRASEPENYGKNSGFFNTIFQLGSVFGIILFGFLVAKLSFGIPILVFGTVPLITGIFLSLLKKVEPRKVDLKDGIRAFKDVITNRLALKFSLVWFSFSLIIASVSGRFPLEIKKYFGLGSIGLITPIFYFFPIVFSYFVGKISDVRGRRSFLIAAYIFVLLGLLLFTIQSQLGLNKNFFILSFLLISFGFAIFAPLKYALLGDISSNYNLEYLTALSILASNGGYVIIFLLNIYFPAIFSFLIPFLIILVSLIIIFPVLKLNINTIKEKIN